MHDTLLLWLILVPLLGAFLCIPLSERLSKSLALVTSLVGLCLGVILYTQFDASQVEKFQLVLSWPWIRSFNINFALGIDGLSFPLVILTKFMMPIAILASWNEDRRARAFMICYLFLDVAMTGTFLATDIFLFYVFWELMLIPMLLLIGVWGSKDRIYAALKFFLYTFVGSILMLVAIFYLFGHFQAQHGAYTSQISSFYHMAFDPDARLFGLNAQAWIFLAFALAFAIKVPMFPLHTWLPDAHVQAPTGGSILLAAVLLKMGTYGLLRFAIPIAPEAFRFFTPGIVVLSLIGIIYGAWVAFQQTDFKKLVAYSSVNHMAFVTLGICAFNVQSMSGAMMQMINHGLSTGALFLLVGMLYERRHTRNFNDFGGIASILPFYSFFLVFVACSSMGVPGLNGFVGEFLVLIGTYLANPLWGMVATTGVIFGSIYMLFMIRRVLFGPVTSAENRGLKDLSPREWAAILPLGIFIVLLGVYPQPLMNKFQPTLAKYLTDISVPQVPANKVSEVKVVAPPVDSPMEENHE